MSDNIKNKILHRVYVPQEIKNIMKHTIIKNSSFKLLGSYTRQSVKYPSDIDIEIKIKSKDKKQIFNDIIESISYILNDNRSNLLVEIKIQLKNGEKNKWEDPNNDLKGLYSYYKDNFKNIDFIKIDYVLYYDELIEFNVMYKLNESKFNKIKYIQDIKQDIDDLTKDNKYYKALKRLFLLYEMDGDDAKTKQLIDIFNSDIGKLNYERNILELIELIKEKKLNNKYIDNAIDNELKKIEIKNIDELTELIENQAKQIYNNLKK